MPRRTCLPLAEYEARRILLIKPSALGDVVQTLPVLTALRRRYPEAHLCWLINQSYEPLLRGHPDLDATLPFDRGAARRGPLAAVGTYVRFLRAFQHQRFDLVVDLQGLFRSGLFTLMSRAPRRVGLSSAREGAAHFYTDVVPVADFQAIHAVDRYWLIAEAFGVGHLPRTFHVPIAEEAHRWAEETLATCPQPWLAFGVGSRWVTKRWPPEQFAVLAQRAQALWGGTILFVGSADEAPLAQRTAAQLRGPWRDLSGKTTLPQLAALLSRMEVMVANDTGPLHLAAALGRPVVAPYTCTKAALNGPYGQEASTVATRLACGGSYFKRCPHQLECMTDVSPERLWPLLQGTLRRWPSTSQSASHSPAVLRHAANS